MRVYLIGAYTVNSNLEAVKIGVALDPRVRIQELQTGNHKELRIIATWNAGSKKLAFDMESKAHHLFRRFRIIGEWFKPHEMDRYIGFMNSRIAESKMITEDRIEEMAAEYLDRSMLYDEFGKYI